MTTALPSSSANQADTLDRAARAFAELLVSHWEYLACHRDVSQTKRPQRPEGSKPVHASACDGERSLARPKRAR